ncbi:MAG TPA: ABC transporter permease [Puia sp.]|nr:ABC transporter permease [Puia sp.]
MLRNYFKTAWRNLLKNKAFSFINILGLAVGLASCLLIMLYIFDESSYDRHQKDIDRIYRIAASGKDGEWVALAAPVGPAVKANFPEVEQSARLLTFPDMTKMLVKFKNGSDQKQFIETNGYYVDSTFFKILSYDFVYGSGATALDEPNTMVISATMSRKYFGHSDPVGKLLLITTPGGEFPYTVKAVFDDQKNKSHIPGNFFLSMRNNDMWNWVKTRTAFVSNALFYTYVKLKPGSDAKAFERKLQSWFETQIREIVRSSGISLQIFLQPLKDIYLHSAAPNEIAANGNITYLYILGSIAAFILLIACINFTNLSTARSEKRAREVGVRKVIGARRGWLIMQFLGESFMLCIIALILALMLVQLFLPFFNGLTEKHIRFMDEPSLLFWVAGLTLLTGLFAGLYPAFFLSSFKPATVLKGKIGKAFLATSLRKGLVVFQFGISICLVFAAIVIKQQMGYLKNKQLGFDKNQKLVVSLQDGHIYDKDHYEALKNELLKYPEVRAVTSASAYPGIVNMNDMLFYGEGQTPADQVDIHLSAVGDNYIQTLGFQMLSGRSFSKEFNDSAGIILNEKALKPLGYTVANAVGKKIRYDFTDFHGVLNIVGVVKDFNFESLHNPIQPCGFTTEVLENRYCYLIADLQTTDYPSIIKKVQTAWSKLDPGIPFGYSFLDQDFQRNYSKEQRTETLVSGFTFIAILIACLGLFGLSAFSAEQRRKEIGVRKVLGASVSSVTALLSTDFIKLVFIAAAIATPAGWWMMNNWLKNFAYQVTIQWWMFLAAGLSAIVVALLTISFQSMKAAMANPVESLRSE